MLRGLRRLRTLGNLRRSDETCEKRQLDDYLRETARLDETTLEKENPVKKIKFPNIIKKEPKREKRDLDMFDRQFAIQNDIMNKHKDQEGLSNNFGNFEIGRWNHKKKINLYNKILAKKKVNLV